MAQAQINKLNSKWKLKFWCDGSNQISERRWDWKQQILSAQFVGCFGWLWALQPEGEISTSFYFIIFNLRFKVSPLSLLFALKMCSIPSIAKCTGTDGLLKVTNGKNTKNKNHYNNNISHCNTLSLRTCRQREPNERVVMSELLSSPNERSRQTRRREKMREICG